MNAFIIGAGFTKAVFPCAPLNGELLDILASCSHHSAAARLGDRYHTREIEIALTRLDADIATTEDQSLASAGSDQQLRWGIEAELADYFRGFTATRELMVRLPWLTSLVDDVFRPGDVAISLNYDCVLEGALDCRGKWSPNEGYGTSLLFSPFVNLSRYRVSAVRVLKIHGSSSFAIAPYYDKPTSSGVRFDVDGHFFPDSGRDMHLPNGAGTEKRYIIAPSYLKTPAVEIAYLMLDALVASSKAQFLVVIGTSLRPEDAFLTLVITSFLHQSDWQARKIIIVGPNADAIGRRLETYWGVDVSRQICTIAAPVQTSVSRLADAVAAGTP